MAGGDAILIPPHLTAHEYSRLAESSGATLCLHDRAFTMPTECMHMECLAIDPISDLEHNSHDAGTQPTHRKARMILQSSGTTAFPKLVIRHAQSLDAVARGVARALGLTGNDRVLVATPICHAYGMENGVLAPL